MSYFSRTRESLRSRSLFRERSVTNAPPTSELSGTRTPRSVIASSGLATRAGLFGGGGSSRMKPASGGGLVVMLSSIADELGGRQWVVEAGRDPGRLSRMLQRLPFSDLDELDGGWPREQLLEMDGRFTARVEAAFQAGLESRVAAAATVRVGHRNGGRQRAEEAVVESAWVWFCQRDREKEVAFSEILARCPGVDPCKVREGFARRFRQFGYELWA